MSAASHLRVILGRETLGRLSLNSFIGQYLLILDFPTDVQGALSDGRLNLQEAAQLARMTPERLGYDPAGTRLVRAEVLGAHKGRLRAPVKDILGETDGITGEQMTAVVHKVDELPEIDPANKRHLFYEG